MEVDKAIKSLLIKDKFYGLICMGLQRRMTSEVPTLAVSFRNMSIELLINNDFWNSLTNDEQLAVIKHEILHITLKHVFMNDSFNDHNLANIAMDAEVNSYITGLPKGAIHASDFGMKDCLGTLEYYRKLKSDADAMNNFSKSGNNVLDSHEWKTSNGNDITEEEKTIIESSLNNVIKNALEQSSSASRGNIPNSILDSFDKDNIQFPRIYNWVAHFRRQIGFIRDVATRSTRRKENFRFPGAPGSVYKKKVKLLVAIDTSGSLNKDQVIRFFGEIDHIRKMGAYIDICECDCEINRIYTYKGKLDGIKGRGGTDFQPVIDYYNKNKRNYNGLIYFTDGYASLPNNAPKNMIWLIDKNGNRQDYPGKTIYIPD